jgi:putative spermidine/putrescine transport system permease protein
VRLGITLYRHPGLQLVLLLALPLLWFVLVYLGSLCTLLAQSVFTFDDFTMSVSRELTLDNYRQLLSPANLDVVLRTLSMASLVSLASAVLAFPLAYYMVRYARGWQKGFFYVAVMLPMWASYIVKVYAWTVLLAKGGIVYWAYQSLGLQGIVDWLMTLPLLGAIRSPPPTWALYRVHLYLAALHDPAHPGGTGAGAGQSAAGQQRSGRQRRANLPACDLPLAFPGVVAGSIFTFSLTLGDYIIPQLIGPSGLFIGSMVYTMQGSIGNMPLAAAFTVVPVCIIGLYLLGARKLGAFDAL